MSDFKGKGSHHRKRDKQKFNDNFDRIFGKKDKSTDKQESKPATCNHTTWHEAI